VKIKRKKEIKSKPNYRKWVDPERNHEIMDGDRVQRK